MRPLEVHSIYDAGEEFGDRYRVVLMPGEYALAIGQTGNVPNGCCYSLTDDQARPAPFDDEQPIEWDALPDAVQRAVTGTIAWAASPDRPEGVEPFPQHSEVNE